MRRAEQNPIVTRDDIPGRDVTSVFNPGAIRWNGDIALLLRVQTRGRETLLWPARSRNGVRFEIAPAPITIEGLDLTGIHHVYDPRLTMLEGVLCVVFAVDTDDGCRLGIARSDDFERFELVSLDAAGERRNGVLFPEKVGGRYLRLERPNTVEGSGDAIWLAKSNDLREWSAVAPVLEGRWHYWDERIGSGPPPLRIDEGWLHLYHGIATHFMAANIYQAGVVLLDADDPTKVLARSSENVLEPREMYELVGQVPNVVFPSGWVRDGDELLIYYGAADTSIGLARTTVKELLDACEPRA
jgi:beta-1,4-mannooligosaccharide/beta-1,4-mannosyl-N-acetylglucosamine phosphorylase